MIQLDHGYTNTPRCSSLVRTGILGRAAMALMLAAMVFAVSPTSVAARQYAAIIVDAETGSVLHAENAELTNRPASLTKMMTLYMVFDSLRDGRWTLGQKLPVSKHAASQSPTKLFLKPGDRISVEDAILATVTKSANDAAVVLAEGISGTESTFARDMTATAHSLGMFRSQFRNASGLPHAEQVTTARDMAILANALYSEFPQYTHFFATPEFRFGRNVYRNHNRLLGSYHGVDGIKTGYTHLSGFNLVTSVRRDGRHVYAVVMGGTTSQARDNQMRKLLDKTFGVKSFAKADSGKVKPAKALASTVKKKKPAPVFVTTKRWSVQVGTFRAHDRAKARAHQAKMVAPSLLQPASVKIETMNKSNKTFYRARFTGLSEVNARRTCRILRSKNFTCMAIQLT